MLAVVVAVMAAGIASASLPLPYVLSFSGSPLLLEVGMEDPYALVSEVTIESGVSTQSYTIPPDAERDPLTLRVSAFLGPGAYELEITLRSVDGREHSDRLDVGFVNFVWGRDNLSFGNNAEYESVVGTVARYQREMNFLQFDIVFDHFLAGPGSAQISRAGARLTDGERTTGRIGYRSREEIADDAGARILVVRPPPAGAEQPDDTEPVAFVVANERPSEGQTVTRRISLR